MQTARRAGVSENVVRSVVTELIETMPKALESAGSEMPKDFPGEISSSIADGLMRRHALLKHEGL